MAEDPSTTRRRQIRVRIDVEMLSRSPRDVRIPVVVDWPELRLTARQLARNAEAAAAGQPEPFPDPSRFDVVLEPTRGRPPVEPPEPPEPPTWLDSEVVPTDLPPPPNDRRGDRPWPWTRRREP